MVDSSTKKSSTNGFYYHADANPIGGTIHRPFSGFIPSNASISLPLVGGFLEKQGRGRKWKNTVTYTSESTHVSGSRKDEANGGPWTTQVSATIEGLNILEVVTADKIVARGPVITWASRSRSRIASSLAVAALARRGLGRQRIVRVAVHPGDTTVPALLDSIDATVARFARSHRPARYDELAAA